MWGGKWSHLRKNVLYYFSVIIEITSLWKSFSFYKINCIIIKYLILYLGRKMTLSWKIFELLGFILTKIDYMCCGSHFNVDFSIENSLAYFVCLLLFVSCFWLYLPPELLVVISAMSCVTISTTCGSIHFINLCKLTHTSIGDLLHHGYSEINFVSWPMPSPFVKKPDFYVWFDSFFKFHRGRFLFVCVSSILLMWT